MDGARLTHIEKFIGTFLAGFMAGHPCLGARSLAAKRDGFYYSVYNDMRTVEAAVLVLDDVENYYNASDENDAVEKSLVCVFAEPIENPKAFANSFWQFVQTMHDIDSLSHAYDPSVSSDPEDSSFELSFRGRAVFPTTLHPASTRTARRFAYPGWALNQSAQFNELRSRNAFEDWKRKIRKADSSFDPSGEPNPLLIDHGTGSPGAQLGGVALPQYPFTARSPQDRPTVARGLIAKAVSEDCSPHIVERLEGILRSFED